MNSVNALLTNQICSLIKCGKISVFNINKKIRVYDIQFYLSELTKVKNCRDKLNNTAAKIINELTEIDDILIREILLSKIFIYCEEYDMDIKNLNPFYRYQCEIQFYKQKILKYEENLLHQRAKDTALCLDENVIKFLTDNLSLHTHLIKLKKHKNYTDAFLVKYQDQPIWRYTSSEIYLYRIYSNGKIEWGTQMQIHEEQFEIKIRDITGHPNNGFGSIAMDFLKEYGKSRGKIKICGSISPVDLETHHDRVIHYYKKNGFNILNVDNRGWYPIEYYL
jgi:hypothetical protein